MSARLDESRSASVLAPSARSCVAALVLAVVSGCAAVTTAEGERLALGSDEFAAYVERVFREQNRVATALAFALEDAQPASARFEALSAAEDTLLAACADLNALAAARRDGERLGPLKGLRAARGAPECERAASSADDLLQ